MERCVSRSAPAPDVAWAASTICHPEPACPTVARLAIMQITNSSLCFAPSERGRNSGRYGCQAARSDHNSCDGLPNIDKSYERMPTTGLMYAACTKNSKAAFRASVGGRTFFSRFLQRGYA